MQVARLWHARFQSIGLLGIVSRFPVPVFCAVSLTILSWLLTGTGERTAPWLRLVFAAFHYLAPFLIAVFLYSFAVQLYRDATGKRVQSLVALVSGIAVLALAFNAYTGLRLLFAPSHTDVIATAMQAAANAYPLLHVGIALSCVLAALALLPFVAPYLRNEPQPGMFWQFAHKLTVALLTATIGAGLAFGGIAAVLATAQLLFAITVPPTFYWRAAIIAFDLSGPLILLALAPADFEELPRTGSAREFTSRSVSLLVRYILIPLATVLSSMLAAYVSLVLLEERFESARLGLRGVLYGTGIIVTALLAYPGASESWIARTFMRVWPWALIPPTLLLFPSIWIRISEYGWTPFRYLVFAAGIWMALLAVAGLRWRYELRTVPGILAAVFALASFGPWGIAEVTGRSQAKLLEALLTEKGMLAEGKWLDKELPVWPAQDRMRVGTMLNELDNAGQLDRLKPWFEGVSNSPFTNSADARRWLNYRLSVGYSPLAPGALPQSFLTFSTPRPRVLKMTSAGYAVGPLHRDTAFTIARANPISSPIGPLDVSLKGLIVEVRESGGKAARFDLTALISEVEKSPASVKIGQANTTLTEPEMRILDGEGDLKVKAAIAEANRNVTQKSVRAEFYLILPAAQ